MKAFFSGVVVFAFVAFFVGCSSSSFTAPNASSEHPPVSTGKQAAVSFSVDFGAAESLAKASAVGDGLNISERQAMFAHLKARTKYLQIVMYKIADSSFNPTYVRSFPVINGICSGTMSVDSGAYNILCYSGGMIHVGTDSMATNDFDSQQMLIVGNSDTSKLNIVLMTSWNLYFGLFIKKGSSALSGVIDSFFNQGIVCSASATPTSVNGYVANFSFGIVKKNFSFYIGQTKYSGLFDITTALTDDIVKMSVTEVKQVSANVSLAFADDLPFAVSSVAPNSGDTVSSGVVGVYVYFNHSLADLDSMPNLNLSVEKVAAGIAIDSNTVGTIAPLNGIGVNGNQIATALSMDPSSRYICRISGTVDQFGKPLSKNRWWVIYTKA